jgi:SAM-dependent methyltransferase
MSEALRAHWQAVYRDKAPPQTSWHRAHLDESLRLIDGLQLTKDAPVLDVGGGRSTLVDDLLARGFADVSVLDLSSAALQDTRARLGVNGLNVRWTALDVLEADLPDARYALWHDRAAFHFLVDPAERTRYAERIARAVRVGGHAVIATFALDGPERCSGLPVARYDAAELAAQFAPAFAHRADSRELHRTPWDSEQAFTYVVLQRHGASA